MKPKNSEEKLNLQCIEKGNKCYISIISKSSYGRNKLLDYLYNGIKPIETNKEYWYEVPYPINKIEKKMSEQKINKRYELKDGYPESELTPKVLNLSSLYDTKYEDVAGLYIQKYDTFPGGFEELEFSVNVIAQRNPNFELKKIPAYVSHYLMDEIETNPALLFEKPCKISSKSMYDIVKRFLETKVDPVYAVLENGYSWRIKVDKRLKLAEPYSTTYNANANNKRRKADWRTQQHTHKTVNVILFEDSSSTKKYPPEIHGKDLDDLNKNLEEYLNNMIKMINEPYDECPHCNGYGVINKNGEKL